MSDSKKKRLQRLVRRAEHLERRIRAGQVVGEELSYDQAEASALRWAVEEIENISLLQVENEQLWRCTATTAHQLQVAVESGDMLRVRHIAGQFQKFVTDWEALG
jgi:hypothetical protein